MAFKFSPLTAQEQLAITKLARARSKPARWVERAKIILLASQPKSVAMIAQELNLSQKPCTFGSNASITKGCQGSVGALYKTLG